jgi:NAD(P)-dependent dehydrogenase (short-subunit alcohol dehydrogenase family)
VLLEGRKAVVAGAASGIGTATAVRLGAEGADVCVAYYTDEEEPRAAAIVDEIRRAGAARGADAFASTVDVGDEDQVAALVSDAVERFGRVDVFVNSAGIQTQSNVVDMPLDVWERVIRTNLTGTFLCVRGGPGDGGEPRGRDRDRVERPPADAVAGVRALLREQGGHAAPHGERGARARAARDPPRQRGPRCDRHADQP